MSPETMKVTHKSPNPNGNPVSMKADAISGARLAKLASVDAGARR
jgi:hypothetical protein